MHRAVGPTTTATTSMMSDDSMGHVSGSDDKVYVPECVASSLSTAALEQLATYDNDIQLDDECVNNEDRKLVVGCNYMGLGQTCRGCYMTCQGALRYLEDYPDQIEEWVSVRHDKRGRRWRSGQQQ